MKKILIVEDNEQNRYLMQYMPEMTGYCAIVAPSGGDAAALPGRLAGQPPVRRRFPLHVHAGADLID